MIEDPPDWLSDGPPLDDAPYLNGSPKDEIRQRAANRRAEEPPKKQAPAAPPQNVWIGTYSDLEALDLPEPATITTLGAIKIVASETVLIYGPSNLGKSLVALHTCIKAAADGAHVLIVEGEGSKRALRERIRKISAGLHASLEEIGSRITIAHGGFALSEQLALWQETIARQAFSIVMLDPLISYFVGDENSSREMQAFLDLVAIARAGGSNVLVVHHATKPDANGNSRERGSSALRAWADEVVALSRGEGPSTAILTHEKSRERGVKPTPQALTWTFSEAMIELAADEAAADAADSAAMKRARIKLLGILSEADDTMPLADVRKKLGNLSGERFTNLLLPMLKDGRILKAESPVLDARGRSRFTETLRIGRIGTSVSSELVPSGHGSNVQSVQRDDADEFGAP